MVFVGPLLNKIIEGRMHLFDAEAGGLSTLLKKTYASYEL
jgi:hypothetical protein